MPAAMVNSSPAMISLLLLLWALLSVPSNAQMLFRGTSILMVPDFNSNHPANATWQTASFYCYFTPVGYVSFGWWLGGDPAKINNTHCNPRSDTYDWYEYSNGSCSDNNQCRFHMVNYMTKMPIKPAFEEDYVVMPLQLGPGEHGLMFLSYFDKVGGATAVGVRELLQAQAGNGAVEDGRECYDAWETLRRLVRKREVPVGFGMRDPCGSGGDRVEQAVLGAGL